MIIHVVQHSQTEEMIMRRVRIVYFLRSPLGRSIIAEVVLFCTVLASTMTFASFKDIVSNIGGTLSQGSFFQYVFSAVANTERGFQALLLVGCVSSVYFLWNVGKKIPFVSFARLVQRPFTHA
ncbi:MAG: hypothetical protein A3C06_02300 [Candidatus Taylorbacteria bacterium RIFCSPHIGHO2_02_FULL_46_13]|uniref:Uncharacterized protein n=1 Tax=Candidatus Taylorbacteria bacterium RIFCSPHIGHO2_02_FULL_46_13 TaxID=1802312 RepID=A0A1G2MVF4_9BACT|nr:MAG: hypothetical protein A3C06_02300 [Candidatus Taylorbacteria bacterium RIFCSPHIGHO2_02_FULL_46_13]